MSSSPRSDASIVTSKRSAVSAVPWKERALRSSSHTSIAFQSAFVQAVNLLYQGAHLTPVATCCDYIAIAKPQVARYPGKPTEKLPPRSSMEKVTHGMTTASLQGMPIRPPECFCRCYMLRCMGTVNDSSRPRALASSPFGWLGSLHLHDADTLTTVLSASAPCFHPETIQRGKGIVLSQVKTF